LQVENYRALRDFKGHGSRAAQGSKPCLVFSGELFETDPVRPKACSNACAPLTRPSRTQTMRAAKSLLLDFFRGRVVPNVNLKGLDRVVICTAVAGRIYFRQCVTRFRKCGSKVPRVELEEMGPRMDLVVRRVREPPPELRKEAYKQAAPPKRQKNVGVDTLVGTVGRVFVPPQEVDNIALSKPKGVKRDRRATAVQDKVARRAVAAELKGGDGDGDEAGAAEVRAAGRRKREQTGDETPQSVGFPLSAGNLVAGKGLKKAPKRSKRAQAEEA
jgi:ribosome production factor 2